MKIEFFLTCIIILFTGYGCVDLGSDLEENIIEESTSFRKDIQPIFDISCATSGCHVSGHSTELDLRDGKSYMEIVNITSIDFFPLKLVEPNKPDSSVLYLKIAGHSSTGSSMPPGGTLKKTNINSIKLWIENGAKNN
jgi:hypothetical protein